MNRMPAFPAFDFSDLDLSRVRMPKIDLADVKMPEIRFPEWKLPAMDLPQVRMPNVDVSDVTLPEVDTDRVLGFARDAAYVSIGLTVLAIQQSQVRRREAQRRISEGVDALRRVVN